MISKRTLIGAMGATALGLTLATTAMAQEVTLRMHQFLPAQANVPKNVLLPWAEKIEAESNGRIKIEHFPSMQLGGKPPELIDQVIDGTADIIWTVTGYTPGRYARTEVFELPFIMTDAETMSRAFWTLAEEEMFDEEFAAFHPLGLWVHGPGVIHSTDPVEEVADLEGMKLRAPTRVTTMLLANLGATPVGMPVPAIPESLSKGVVEAAIIPWEVVGGLKVSELVENHTEFPDKALYTNTFIFAMNKAKYEALPDDLKKVIDDNSGYEFSAFAGKQMQEDDAGPRAAALEMGNNIIELTPEQAAEWEAASKSTTEAWIKEMDENGLDGTGLMEKAKKLLVEHGG